jgi:hypothetical protein
VAGRPLDASADFLEGCSQVIPRRFLGNDGFLHFLTKYLGYLDFNIGPTRTRTLDPLAYNQRGELVLDGEHQYSLRTSPGAGK